MKKILFFIVLALILIEIFQYGHGTLSVNIQLPGKEAIAVKKPLVRNSKILVPLYSFAEGIGAKVYVNPKNGDITLDDGKKQIKMWMVITWL